MKKNHWIMMCLVALCLVFSLSFICAAADLSGVWNLQVQTPGGTGTPTFILKQEAEKLTGTYKSQWGEFDCKGTVKGNSFEVTADVGGNMFVYTGVVDGNKMSGKVDLGGQASGDFTGDKAK